MKYKDFDDWFNELEGYCMRSERFLDEFDALDYIKKQRLIEWLQASWDCARMKSENDN